jgi:hypothetical protein
MRFVRASVLVGLLCVAGCAALFGKGKTFGPEDGDIPEGTQFIVRLEAPLTSRFSHLNETVRARSIDAVFTDTGVLMLPAGTLFTGTVHDRIGPRIWIRLDRAVIDGYPQRVRARFLGAENGFIGSLHAGDRLLVRLEEPMWSVVAVRERLDGTR